MLIKNSQLIINIKAQKKYSKNAFAFKINKCTFATPFIWGWNV